MGPRLHGGDKSGNPHPPARHLSLIGDYGEWLPYVEKGDDPSALREKVPDRADEGIG